MILTEAGQSLSRNYSTDTHQNDLQESSLLSKLRGLSESSANESKETENESELIENKGDDRTSSPKKLESIHERYSDMGSDIEDSYLESYNDGEVRKKGAREFNLAQTYDIINMHEDFDLNETIQEPKEEDPVMMLELKVEYQPTPEQLEQMFFVRDVDTGQFYDMRDAEQVNKIKEMCAAPSEKKIDGVPWKQYWKNVRRNNELLWDYCESGNVEKVQELLVNSKTNPYPAQVNSRLLDDMTALHLVASEGHIEMVKTLLRFGANIDAKTKMGRTPLHIAVLRGNLEMVKALLSEGANINATDKEFSSPLHYASEHGFIELVEELLSRAPNVAQKNHAGLTSLDVALNSATWKIFENWNLDNQTMRSNFGRIFLDNFLIYNSRADYVSKTLFLINKQYRQSNGVINPAKCGLTREEEERKNNRTKKDLRDRPRFRSGISKIIIRYNTNKITNTSVDNLRDTTIQEMEKVGPHSFICHTLLGKGSFGEVYLVEKISNKKLYAMKVLKKDKVLSQNLTRYAKAERNVLSIMNHPFIVKLHYAFQTDAKLFLLLEFCPGGDLGNLLSKKKRLSEEVAKIYAAEVTLALEALHKNHIIFRDLKPDNVVLDEEGHAMITDFGLSKEGISNNLSKSFCGSVAYLAPEMLRRAGHNRTVDWYLLGVLIYEMLVGVPPYFSSNRQELFENIQKAQLRLPKSMSDEAKHLIKSVTRFKRTLKKFYT